MIINLIQDMWTHFYLGLTIAIRFFFLKAAFFAAIILILIICKVGYMNYKKYLKNK